MLAFVAGFINVVGLLGFEHQALSHVTGTSSRLAEAMANLDVQATLHFSASIGAFVVGTVLSGILIQDATLQLGRQYSLALLLEALLLFLSVPLLKYRSVYGMYAAACACGIQNAMVSTYSGAVIRTTHVSGMFTDLGIALGHALRGRSLHARRVKLYLSGIGGFLGGGIVGTLIFQRFKYEALLFPAVLTAIVSVAYEVYRAFRKRTAESDPQI